MESVTQSSTPGAMIRHATGGWEISAVFVTGGSDTENAAPWHGESGGSVLSGGTN